MNEKVYIHEFISITGQNRARYMHHMAANWSPIAQEQRQQLCYGVWGVVGSTGPASPVGIIGRKRGGDERGTAASRRDVAGVAQPRHVDAAIEVKADHRNAAVNSAVDNDLG